MTYNMLIGHILQLSINSRRKSSLCSYENIWTEFVKTFSLKIYSDFLEHPLLNIKPLRNKTISEPIHILKLAVVMMILKNVHINIYQRQTLNPFCGSRIVHRTMSKQLRAIKHQDACILVKPCITTISSVRKFKSINLCKNFILLTPALCGPILHQGIMI